MLIGSLITALAIRSNIERQERAVISVRAAELAADVSVAVATLDYSLRPLSAINLKPSGDAELFDDQARALTLNSPGTTVLYTQDNDVVYRSGPELTNEQIFTTQTQRAFVRAQALPASSKLHLANAGLINANGRQLLGFAYHAPNFPSGANIFVTFEVARFAGQLDQQTPLFRSVNFTASVNNAAVFQNIDNAKQYGPLVERSIQLGADKWTISVQSREKLVGAITPGLGWLALLVGVVFAVLITALIENTFRRRDHALTIVDTQHVALAGHEQERSERTAQNTFLRITARQVAAAPSLSAAFDVFSEAIATSVEFDRINLSMIGDRTAQITATAGPMANALPVGLVWPKSDELIERVMDTGQSGILDIEDSVLTATGPQILSRMGVPIFVGGALHALITLASVRPHAFDEADLHAVERVTREAAGPLYLLSVLDRERDASKRLQQLDELKSDFVGMVAHDLRSPMTVISGFADFLLAHFTTLEAKEIDLYLNRISDSTKHLSAFVEDILQVARIEAGEIRIDLTEFDLGQLLRDTVEGLAIAHQNRELNLDIEPHLPLAVGDRARQWQIITNLVNNALKFSERNNAPVHVNAAAGDGEILVSVTDYGLGIDADSLPRIFDKFYQVEQHRRRAPTSAVGSGLGLYICKSLVEAQHGAIAVQSSPQSGTTFTYSVPCARQPNATTPHQ